MHYLSGFGLLIFLVACSHLNTNSTHFETKTPLAELSATTIDAYSSEPTNSDSIADGFVKPKITANLNFHEDQSSLKKTREIPTNKLAQPTAIDISSSVVTSSPENNDNHFLHIIFDYKTLLYQPESPADSPGNAFLSLTNKTNNPVKLSKDDPLPEGGGFKNLVDRIPNGFQLDLNIDNRRIRNQLNWYVRNPDYLNRTFRRAARYMHFIVKEVEKRDMPLELALLPFVESAYDPFAYSHGRASGLWQFIPGTGKMYGLYQNWWYDGRRDIPASTKAALDYLSHLNKKFDGNWLHALAAYNSGARRVNNAIIKNRKKSRPTDFWSLKLPRETKAYVPKLLAMAKIVANPTRYDVSLPPIEDKPYFSIVNIDGQIDLAQAASLAEVDINEIYKLNPGFNQWATAPLGPHRLLIPNEQVIPFANNLKELPKKKRLAWNRYSVKRGDSLIRIARRFNTTPGLIKQVNRLSSNMIREKQKLLIPIASKGRNYYDLSEQNRLASKQSNIRGGAGSSKIIHTVKSGDTVWDLARSHKVGVRAIAKWNGMAPTDVLKPGRELLIWSNANQLIATPISIPLTQQRQMIKRIGYRVKRGDSLARIASKFNVSIKDIIVWNKLNKKKYLQPGQKLTLFVDLSNS